MRDPVYGNNRIAGIPNDVLRTVVSYRSPKRLLLRPVGGLGAAGAVRGPRQHPAGARYALFNIQTGLDFASGVSLFVDARNLTDERYISDIAVVNDARNTGGGAAALAAFYPGNGRSVFAACAPRSRVFFAELEAGPAQDDAVKSINESTQQNHRSMKRQTMRAAAGVEKTRWMSARRSLRMAR